MNKQIFLLLALVLSQCMCIQRLTAANQSSEIVEGVLAGLGIQTNKTITENCIRSAGDLQNLKEHDWSTLIQWQHNSVKDIPLINSTLLTEVVAQLFDDSEQVIRQCGLLVEHSYVMLKEVIQSLETSQGWSDLGKRLQKNGFTIAMELYGAVDDLQKQKYYEGGYQIGAILKQVLIPVHTGVVATQIRQQRMRLIDLQKNMPYLLLIKRVTKSIQQNGVQVDILSTLKDIMKGFLEGLMHLPDTPDFVGCVFSGLSAKTFFQSLNKTNIATVKALADTIKESKAVVLPVVTNCLVSVDDLLTDVDQAIQFYVNYNGNNLLKVMDKDAEFIGRNVADAVKYFINKDNVSGSAQITIMMEQIIQDLYTLDQQDKNITY